MSEAESAPTQADHDPGAVKVEPDNVPTRFLSMLAVAITVVVVVLVIGVIQLFDAMVADEMVRKGYTATGAIPHEVVQ